MSISNHDPRPELIRTAQYFHQKNWMLGTAGNLSARFPDGRFWITASGKSKGNLTLENFVLINTQGEPETTMSAKPSAETIIHQTLYHRFPSAQACYHIHSVHNNVVSWRCADGQLTKDLLPAEMLKGFGLKSEIPHCKIPIFENNLEVAYIAKEINQYFARNEPIIPALLIREHGLTVWADSLERACNYVELLEYMFHYMILCEQFER